MTVQTWPKTPQEARSLIRSGQWKGVTAKVAQGHTQANLAIVPRGLAFDFLLFCQRNPKPCPLLEVVEMGEFEPRHIAPGADLRTDLPMYRVFKSGELVAEVDEISGWWRDDLVSFLLGCSFTFESALVNAGISLRHWEEGKSVPMYVTNVETEPAGGFSGPMVVSMRPIHRSQVIRAVQVTSRYPLVHGAPVHIGDPSAIGIDDITWPDYGDPTEIRNDEVPVFWACGVTPQAVALKAKPSFMITHAPGHMFVADLRDEELAIL